MKRKLFVLLVCVFATVGVKAAYTIDLSNLQGKTLAEAIADFEAQGDKALVITGSELAAEDVSALADITTATTIKMDGVTLGEGAAYKNFNFTQATAVTSIVLPKDLPDVKESWFTGCTNLGSAISISSDGKTLRAYNKVQNTMVDAVKLAGLWTNLNSLNELYIAGKVGQHDLATNYGENNALCNVGQKMTHYDLTYATLVDDSGNNDDTVIRNVNYGGYSAQNLTQIEFPKTLKDIPDECFQGCGKLKFVGIPEGVETIGVNAFTRCTELEVVRIPTTLKEIKHDAFNECKRLHVMTFPRPKPGVQLIIREHAFDQAGLTDIYILAQSVEEVPLIYAQKPQQGNQLGNSTFQANKTNGNNTDPKDRDFSTVDRTEVLTWYQEEQSNGGIIGSGNCLCVLHYPESMKKFYEAPDLSTSLTAAEQAQIPNWDVYGDVDNLKAAVLDYIVTDTQVNATTNQSSVTESKIDAAITGRTFAAGYALGSHELISPTDNCVPTLGPDINGKYYPGQWDYMIRVFSGATGSLSGFDSDPKVLSQMGWRQFQFSTSVEDEGEIIYEKLYDDTWYTLCFPWRMTDRQLLEFYGTNCEIVEFVGAEIFAADGEPAEGSDEIMNYNLVFHFDKVVKARYFDLDDVEYTRAGSGAANYTYTPVGGGTSITASSDPVKYLQIQNIMAVAGHPYMIHPARGATPGNVERIDFTGIRMAAEGNEALNALADAQKVTKTITSNEKGGTSATAWTNPDGIGGEYTFIGNISDGPKTMTPPCYFLGLSPSSDNYYPKYYRRAPGGTNTGKWSQYSAIIVPDDDAKSSVEAHFSNQQSSGGGSSAGAKSAGVHFGQYNFDDAEIIEEHGIATVIKEALEKDKNAEVIRMNVVYNINGQIVRADSGSVEGLPKGFYIVNGKKYMVK